MPIYSWCQTCKTSSPLGARVCTRCRLPFPKSKKYRVHVIVDGKTIVRVADNLALARELEATLKADMVRGKFDLIKKKSPTLAQFFDEKYLPHAKETKRSWRDDAYYFNAHIRPRLGDKRLDKIAPLDIERLRMELQRGTNKRSVPFKPATVKHVLVIIRRCFNLAFKWGVYDGTNPMSKVTMPRVDNTLVRFLTPEETSRLLDVLETWPCRETASFIKFAFFTGLRRGEIMKLRWEDVDFSSGLVTLRTPKGGKTTTLPIAKEALEALGELPRKSDFVFPGRNGGPRTDFKGPWARIRKAAKLPEYYRLHDLRHHFASALVSSGVGLEVVSTLLTHKDLKTTQRYAHLSPGALREAVKKVGEVVAPPKEPIRRDNGLE